jgi:large subunit ribosomal protein L6
MSRIAKMPVTVPAGVEIKVDSAKVSVKGPKGQLTQDIHPLVEIRKGEEGYTVAALGPTALARAMSGTTRALLGNMVRGVHKGFEKKLTILGVGYRAAVQGKTLNLTLGFSHPLAYPIPAGITVETPSQTEIVIRGADRQQVGQVAAEIRAFRGPEPYKGKGVRYADEVIVKKEAKKK